MNGNKKERGITLIELLVVMVIIAMFATIVGQRLFRNVEKARQTTAKAQIGEFESVLDAFRLDVGRYPTAEEGLQSLRARPAASKDGMARTSEKTFHSIPGSGLTSTGFPANMAIMTSTPLAPTDKTAARAKTPT